jgi:hypothetical protein
MQTTFATTAPWSCPPARTVTEPHGRRSARG